MSAAPIRWRSKAIAEGLVETILRRLSVKALHSGIGACLNQPDLRGYPLHGLFATLIRSIKESPCSV
jgi:hypothetical protein